MDTQQVIAREQLAIDFVQKTSYTTTIIQNYYSCQQRFQDYV